MTVTEIEESVEPMAKLNPYLPATRLLACALLLACKWTRQYCGDK